ncbi:MAG: hypothetical protein DMF98_07090 [Acidobacteria bacterium]|nr:MAG: hypothetical protein DMF98_07090 [Acidobacteriota bacterium]
MNMLGRGEPLQLYGSAVSADLFPTLGVQPLAGRLFAATDDREGAPSAVLLSYRLWQTEFGGELDGTIGQTITLDNVPYSIIGIMPREFRFPSSDAALWTAMRLTERNYQDRNDNWLEAVGRLRPGVTIEQARAALVVPSGRVKNPWRPPLGGLLTSGCRLRALRYGAPRRSEAKAGSRTHVRVILSHALQACRDYRPEGPHYGFTAEAQMRRWRCPMARRSCRRRTR